MRKVWHYERAKNWIDVALVAIISEMTRCENVGWYSVVYPHNFGRRPTMLFAEDVDFDWQLARISEAACPPLVVLLCP